MVTALDKFLFIEKAPQECISNMESLTLIIQVMTKIKI